MSSIIVPPSLIVKSETLVTLKKNTIVEEVPEHIRFAIQLQEEQFELQNNLIQHNLGIL
jgi:hypothetical protein